MLPDRAAGCLHFLLVAIAPLVLSLAIPAHAAQAETRPGADWAVDPTTPGENLPPVGRSLFDFLVVRNRADRAVYDVPFPITALIRKLEGELERDRGDPLVVKSVLIPLGRSLQRTAAAPDFFASPRLVLTTNAEPRHVPTRAGMLLKDRIYLGFQEKAQVVEVISYNEAAGRFEFQVVKDYRPGGTPRVFYANRAICTSCHQNAAPIFPRQLWDETNANRGVAALLRQRQASFYGTDVDRGVDVPYGVDNASDRANFFTAYQLLWRDGCEISGDPQRSSRCRAALYTAALQYRLSGKQQFERSAAALREYARPALARSAREYWPQGLRIPNADLPNRDPLASGGPDGAAPDGADGAYAPLSARVDVHATFDPLAPRTPSDVWDVAAPLTLDRLVSGLSEFLAESDVQRLSAALAGAPASKKAMRTTYEADCELTRSQRSASAYRIDFRCVPPREGARGALLQGKLYVDRGKAVHGSLERILMREEGLGESELRDIDIAGGKLASAAAGWHAVLPLARGTTRARRSDGNALEHVRLESDRSLQAAAASVRGHAKIVVVHDFAPVHAIVENMIVDSASGRTDVFANKPFRRVALMSTLLERAGVKSLAWCCMEAHGMPPAAMDGHTVASHDRAQADAKPLALQPFFRYCATCHQSNERTPPNFLQGSASAVAANLAHCAQRLHVRLAMWQLPAEHRPKTPMPPHYALHGFQTSPQHWAQSGELAALRSHVERLLQSEHGKVPPAEELLRRGYENLRSCLPEAS